MSICQLRPLAAACPGQLAWSNHGKPLCLDKVYGHRVGLNILTFKKALKGNTSKCSFWAHMKKNTI